LGLYSISTLLERNGTRVWTFMMHFCYLSDRACKQKQDLLSAYALSKSYRCVLQLASSTVHARFQALTSVET